jgi:hopanoid biosynthesis associated radical SAM protein HpnH
MGIPAGQMARIGAYVVRQTLGGSRRFPLVLMLEPLFRCNLRCQGCGKASGAAAGPERLLGVEECTAAAEECDAPIVSIPGGEPLLHPDIPRIVSALTARGRFVYLCTNALLVKERIGEFRPSPYLTFNVHLDGLRERHDLLVGRDGFFDAAAAAIRLLLARGFRVTTNTTVFAGEAPENAARLFDFLTALGVEGMTVSPAFGYEEAPDRGRFPTRGETRVLFRRLFATGRGRNWRFNHSRPYLDFLAGRRELSCSPWGNPTRNAFGWQRPCYLLGDGYAATYRDLMETTDWDRYGPGRDPRCADCMVHSGFEPTAVVETMRRPFAALRACAP